MIAAISIIAEQRIREAMDKGEFDDLQGRGLPLDLDEGANVPPELRMAWKLLKNGGYLDGADGEPWRRESLDGMLGTSPDEQAALRRMLKLQVVESRFARKGGRELSLDADGVYRDKVVEKISVKMGGGA